MRQLFRIFVVIMTVLPFVSSGLTQDLEITGQYRGETELFSNDSSYAHQHWINLVLEKSLGQGARMHINLEMNTYGSGAITPLMQEAFVDYYTNHIDYRFGKQIVSWGSAYKLNPTSYFNPYDLTIITPGEKRMGVIAAAARYYGPARIEIAGVLSPFFASHQLPPGTGEQMLEQSSEQTLQKMNHSISYPGISVAMDPANPFVPPEVEPNLKNTTGGIQITKRGLLNTDVSLSAYHGRDKFMTVEEDMTEESIFLATQDPTQLDTLVTVYFTYPRVNRLGLDIIGTVGDAGFWIEGTYSMYSPDYLDDATSIVTGADYRFANDLYLVVQGIYNTSRTAEQEDMKAIMGYLSKPLFGFHKIEFMGLYDTKTESFFLQPQFRYSLGNAVALEFGGTLVHLEGGHASLFSRMISDRLYARLTIDF